MFLSFGVLGSLFRVLSFVYACGGVIIHAIVIAIKKKSDCANFQLVWQFEWENKTVVAFYHMWIIWLEIFLNGKYSVFEKKSGGLLWTIEEIIL